MSQKNNITFLDKSASTGPLTPAPTPLSDKLLSWLLTTLHRNLQQVNRVMRKPIFCNCENKGADQLHGNSLCFHYIDSTIPVHSKSKFQASSHLLWLYSPVSDIVNSLKRGPNKVYIRWMNMPLIQMHENIAFIQS